MASLGAYLLAGTATAVGSNLLQQAKEKREERIAQLERDFTLTRDQTNRDFQSGEAQKSREFQLTESQADRDFKMKTGGESVTFDDGTLGNKIGGTVTQVKGPDGKPAKLLGAAKDEPNEVSTAKWLVREGIAKDSDDAWRQVRLSKTAPDKLRADMVKTLITAATKDSFGQVDMEEVTTKAMEQADRILRNLRETEATDEGGAAPSSTAPPPPKDKSALVTGQVYTTADGRKVRWDGTGFLKVN